MCLFAFILFLGIATQNQQHARCLLKQSLLLGTPIDTILPGSDPISRLSGWHPGISLLMATEYQNPVAGSE